MKKAKDKLDEENKNLKGNTNKYDFVDYLLEDDEALIEKTVDAINKIDRFPWLDCEIEQSVKVGWIRELEPEGTWRFGKKSLDKKSALDTNIIVFKHDHILLKDEDGWQTFIDGNSPFGVLPKFQLDGESSYIICHAARRYLNQECRRWLFKIDAIFDVKKEEWIECSEIAKSTAFDSAREVLKNPDYDYFAVEAQMVSFGIHHTIDKKTVRKNEKMNEEGYDENGKPIKKKRYYLRGKL